MSDLPARLDRLADLATRTSGLSSPWTSWGDQETWEEFLSTADPLTVAALVKVAQAVETQHGSYACPLCGVAEDFDHFEDCPLAVLDVQLEKGEQDG